MLPFIYIDFSKVLTMYWYEMRLYSFNWSNFFTFESILILRLKISLLLTFQNLEVTNYVYRWLSICWFLYLYQLSRAQHHAHQLSSIYKWLSKQQRWAVNDAKLKVAEIACIELHMFVDFKTNCQILYFDIQILLLLLIWLYKI